MCKLRVKNFGPIKEGLLSNDGWIEFKKVTVLIGNQGSGKSTIAKIMSTCTWLEKALYKGEFTEDHLKQYNRFKKHFSYQRLFFYFKNETHIEYVGSTYSFEYQNNNLTIEKTSGASYLVPKIMYVPAERNLLTIVEKDKGDRLKNLPLPLYTFSDEFIAAKKVNFGKVNLPINNISFLYKKQNALSYLVGADYEIELSKSSSGFQSLVPLYLVSKYLSESISRPENADDIKQISNRDEQKIKLEIAKILSNTKLNEDVKMLALEQLSSKYRCDRFMNIVEEPEQNLYPSSQKSILFELFRFADSQEDSQLLLTTHSPYILSYLTQAVKAKEVERKIEASPTSAEEKATLTAKLNEIVFKEARVNENAYAVYQIDDNGIISYLENYHGLPNDENLLNDALGQMNEVFSDLIELELQCQKG